MTNVFTLWNVRIYLTLSGDWRAYIKDNSGLQAWGYSKSAAVANLGKVLAAKNIPFDFSVCN